MPLSARRSATGLGRIGILHDDRAGIEAAGEQPRQDRSAHLARAGEQQRTLHCESHLGAPLVTGVVGALVLGLALGLEHGRDQRLAASLPAQTTNWKA